MSVASSSVRTLPPVSTHLEATTVHAQPAILITTAAQTLMIVPASPVTTPQSKLQLSKFSIYLEKKFITAVTTTQMSKTCPVF